MILPETAAERLLVEHGRVVGVRTGDKGRGREGEPLGNFEPGADIVAKVTVLAEGTAGHLTQAAIERFGLEAAQPADLGARREGGLARAAAAAQDRAHDGLAAANGQALPGVRRLVRLPDGRRPRLARLRRRARLPRRGAVGPRPAAGAEDAPAPAQDPRRGRARRVGREDDHERGLPLPPVEAERSRAPARRRERGPRQRPAPQGRALRDRVGAARRGVRLRGAATRRAPRPRRCARHLRRRRSGTATCGTRCTRCATCGRRSTRASSSAARSPAR